MDTDKYMWERYSDEDGVRFNMFHKETGLRVGFVYISEGAWDAVSGHLLLASYQTLDQAKAAVEAHLGLSK